GLAHEPLSEEMNALLDGDLRSVPQPLAGLRHVRRGDQHVPRLRRQRLDARRALQLPAQQADQVLERDDALAAQVVDLVPAARVEGGHGSPDDVADVGVVAGTRSTTWAASASS